MRKLYRKNILKVRPYEPGLPIEEVKRRLKLDKIIKLASNENALPTPAGVVRAISKEARNLNRYPDGSCFYLKRQLAKVLKIKENCITFGNGSDEIIVLTLRAFVNPKDEVIVSYPSFLIYDIASTIQGAAIKRVPLSDYRYDLNAIKKKISKKTKIIFIANPNNPTGTYVSKKEVGEFLKGLPSDIIVYFDEAYFELVDKKDFPDTLSLLRQGKNIIITRTFSKAYSLAGLRIGYAISNPKIIACLNRVREPFNVNSLAQVAALVSLDDKSYLRKTKRTLKQGIKYLYANFNKLGLRFIPSAANFILVNVGSNSGEIFNKLLKRGVIVRDMRLWGLKNFIRVTIGTMKENRIFINALKEIIAKINLREE